MNMKISKNKQAVKINDVTIMVNTINKIKVDCHENLYKGKLEGIYWYLDVKTNFDNLNFSVKDEKEGNKAKAKLEKLLGLEF